MTRRIHRTVKTAGRPSGATAVEAANFLRSVADPRHAALLQRYFKTGPGEYGAGDRFLGIRLPAIRRTVTRFVSLSHSQLARLLRSRWHEERMLALLIMVRRYRRGDAEERDHIFDLYLQNLERVNNWDLVDLSAPNIIGAHLSGGDSTLIVELARSESVWKRRMAVLSTFHDIQSGKFKTALRLAAMLLGDEHDLMHKATGWMLREIGKRDREVEERFLRKYVKRMPRTMLRYAIERFPDSLRRSYLNA